MTKCRSCNGEGHKRSSKKCPNYVAKPKIKKMKENNVKVSDIITFFTNQIKKDNDISNRTREKIILLLAEQNHTFFNDQEYGEKWCKLRTEFEKYVKTYLKVPLFTHYTLQLKAGLGNHEDFVLTIYNNQEIVKKIERFEFKNNSMPQFANEFDGYRYVPVTLAEYWFDEGYLDKIITAATKHIKLQYQKPSREEYLKGATQMLGEKSKPSFFKQFRDLERANAEFYKEKQTISNEGIETYLKKHGNSFNANKLKEKFQKEQTSKEYFIWKTDKQCFEYHYITNDELSPSKVSCVTKNNVYLTAGPSEIHCLLRWKNTIGICVPAWQVKLVRSNK